MPPNYVLGSMTRTYHKHDNLAKVSNTKDVPDKFYHSTGSCHGGKENRVTEVMVLGPRPNLLHVLWTATMHGH